MRPRALRATVQVFFLVFFTILFYLAAYPLPDLLPVDLLLRIDPLAALISFLASRTIVPRMLLSLVLLGATFLFGRFFCGYVCPLGTTIDLSDGLLARSKLVPPSARTIPRIPKYYLLCLLLFLALCGRSLIWPFDPLVLFKRSLVVLFHPATLFLTNRGLDLLRPLAERWELNSLVDATLTEPDYSFWTLPLILVIIVLGLGFLGRRFWCRALCPLGALLASVARFSPLRRMIAEESCKQCGLCRRICPTGAIEGKRAQIVLGECIECRACATLCPEKAISFRPQRSVGRKLNWDRRRFIWVALFGLGSFSFSRIIPRVSALHVRRIRPPGATPEEVFLSRCLRCGECMKVCLTNGLQPATDEAGPLGIWTPILIPRRGPCERYCNLCGQVCPTQAIRALTLEEKSYACIGRAHVDRSRCLEWEYGRACLVCDEVCPYGAIFVGRAGGEMNDRRGPVVDPEVCVGCGVCEKHCPVDGQAAIRVSAWGEDRLLKGSYITPQKATARQKVSGDYSSLEK